MSLQIERSREKMSRCRTEREANAVQRELEELRKLYRDREIEVEKLSSLVEQARSELESVLSEREALMNELNESEGSVQASLGELGQKSAEQEARRKLLVAKVESKLYRRYELVRKRRGTAIAAAVNGSCQSCHMQLPPMLFQQLRHAQDLMQCPSCSRILHYHPDAAEAAEPSAS